VEPLTTAALVGVIVIAVSWADGTVTVALPQIEPAHACTVVVPAAVAYTVPEFVESLVTVAMLAFEEFQEAEASVSTLLSLNVPVRRHTKPHSPSDI